VTDDLERALRRPGALPALLAALGILGALVVLGFLQATLAALSAVAATPLGSEFFAEVWATQLAAALAGPVPIAVGVFLCFWQIAPIAPGLRLAHVVTRALLAALAGGVLLLAAGLLGGLLQWMLGQGEVAPLALLFRTLWVLVSVLPVVVLGAVLLWGWLQRHPPKRSVRGALDEV